MNFKIIFRNIGHFISFPFVALSLKLGLQKAKRLHKVYISDSEELNDDERFSFVNKQVAKACFLSNCKIIVTGIDKIPNVPVMFVCNHKSEFDPLILIKVFSKREIIKTIFVSKQELGDKKGIGHAAKLIDTIFIDRKNIRSAIKCLEEEKKALQKRNVAVFIEGTRIKTHQFGEFKSAALEPAFTTMRSIVPVVIQGSMGIEPSNAKGFLRYKEVNVEFLPPIKYKDYIGFSRDAMADKLKNQMQKVYLNYEKENKSIFYKGDENIDLLVASINDKKENKKNSNTILKNENNKQNDVDIKSKTNSRNIIPKNEYKTKQNNKKVNCPTRKQQSR